MSEAEPVDSRDFSPDQSRENLSEDPEIVEVSELNQEAEYEDDGEDDQREDRPRSRSPSRDRSEQRQYNSRDRRDDRDELTLFVSGIHPKIDEEQLRVMFDQYEGIKSTSIMRDPHSNDSRGFGFVSFETSESALQAKQGLHGNVIEGRTLQIEFAKRNRPRTPTPGMYQGHGSRRGFRGRGRYGRYMDRRGGGIHTPRFHSHNQAEYRYEDRQNGLRPTPYGRPDSRPEGRENLRAPLPGRLDHGYREREPVRPGYGPGPSREFAERTSYGPAYGRDFRRDFDDRREGQYPNDRREYGGTVYERPRYNDRSDYNRERDPRVGGGYENQQSIPSGQVPHSGGFERGYPRRGGYNDRSGFERGYSDRPYARGPPPPPPPPQVSAPPLGVNSAEYSRENNRYDSRHGYMNPSYMGPGGSYDNYGSTRGPPSGPTRGGYEYQRGRGNNRGRY
ncbi:uncharacterized protein V1516DRAFT_664183 [Lipomyces oligophaga]|uniref:uncharacterized protein n=1 Tax=Lipomyces oligophaga TaxID=45792 RepID=UPI0034CF4AF4